METMKSGIESFVKQRKKHTVNSVRSNLPRTSADKTIAGAKAESGVQHEKPKSAKRKVHGSSDRSGGIKKHKDGVFCAYSEKCSLVEFDSMWQNYTLENLTQVERDECSALGSKFVSGSLKNSSDEDLNKFLKNQIFGWENFLNEPKLAKGSPFVVVVCGSAIRAVNLTREINDFKTTKCKTAKLFAKHMKLEEQKKFLTDHPVHLAIGTPQRINDLLKCKALRLSNMKFLVLDWSFCDVKKRRMMDYPYIKDSVFDFLKNCLLNDAAVDNLQGVLL